MADEKKLYTPSEAAAKLGVSTKVLKYMRSTGKIQGMEVAKNVTLYTDEQLKHADMSRRPPGVKPKKKQQKEEDGYPPSVTPMASSLSDHSPAAAGAA